MSWIRNHKNLVYRIAVGAAALYLPVSFGLVFNCIGAGRSWRQRLQPGIMGNSMRYRKTACAVLAEML